SPTLERMRRSTGKGQRGKTQLHAPLQARAIAFREKVTVVYHMPRDDIAQRANRKLIAIHGAGSFHHFLSETPEKIECRSSQICKLVAQAGKVAVICIGLRSVIFLFKSRQRR